MKLALPGTIVGPLVELVVEVLVLEVDVERVDETGVDVGLVVLARVDELDEPGDEVVDVVEALEVVAATPEVLEEIVDVVDERLEEAAAPFLYILRRLGPPQYVFLSALQTMLHCVIAGVLPATKADPA